MRFSEQAGLILGNMILDSTDFGSGVDGQRIGLLGDLIGLVPRSALWVLLPLTVIVACPGRFQRAWPVVAEWIVQVLLSRFLTRVLEPQGPPPR